MNSIQGRRKVPTFQTCSYFVFLLLVSNTTGFFWDFSGVFKSTNSIYWFITDLFSSIKLFEYSSGIWLFEGSVGNCEGTDTLDEGRWDVVPYLYRYPIDYNDVNGHWDLDWSLRRTGRVCDSTEREKEGKKIRKIKERSKLKERKNRKRHTSEEKVDDLHRRRYVFLRIDIRRYPDSSFGILDVCMYVPLKR